MRYTKHFIQTCVPLALIKVRLTENFWKCKHIRVHHVHWTHGGAVNWSLLVSKLHQQSTPYWVLKSIQLIPGIVRTLGTHITCIRNTWNKQNITLYNNTLNVGYNHIPYINSSISYSHPSQVIDLDLSYCNSFNTEKCAVGIVMMKDLPVVSLRSQYSRPGMRLKRRVRYPWVRPMGAVICRRVLREEVL